MYWFIHKMNNLFGKGREKILEFFYLNKFKESYFSEILKETNLTPNTTLNHLKVLQKSNLIISTKKTNNTFYKLNKAEPLVYSILSYFDFKKFNSLPSERKSAISSFLEKINVKPLIVLLFGSTATNNFSKESDIDLLLIFNKKELKNKKLLEDIEAVTGVKIQTFVIDLEYFEDQILRNEDKVVSHAIKTGYPVNGFEQVYKRIIK